jgi:transcriptional regulator with XRE-family HTH domain
MDIYKVIGDNIRGFRAKQGWTQEKLAIRAKLNTNYLGNVERAEKKVSIDTLQKIGKVLHVDLHLFFVSDAYKKE